MLQDIKRRGSEILMRLKIGVKGLDMPMADGSMLSVDNCRMETAVLWMKAFSSPSVW